MSDFLRLPYQISATIGFSPPYVDFKTAGQGSTVRLLHISLKIGSHAMKDQGFSATRNR